MTRALTLIQLLKRTIRSLISRAFHRFPRFLHQSKVHGILLAALFVMGLSGCQKEQAAPVALQPIQLLDLEGQVFDPWQKPGGLTVVLFTRSDCPISNRCAPEVRRLHEKYHSRGVSFYLIYVDPQEQPDTLRKHIKEYDYPCQGLRDPKHTLVAHCGATTTPEAVLFGSDRGIVYQGRVDDRYSGFGEARAQPTTYDLADAIEATLQGQPVANPRTKAIGCLIADLKD